MGMLVQWTRPLVQPFVETDYCGMSPTINLLPLVLAV